jgi:hypothetical protein
MKLKIALILLSIWSVVPRMLYASGQLEIRAVDHDTGKPLAVRMHLKNAQGKPVKPPGVPALGDHFVFFDKVVLRLPNGGYEFLMERGPEYLEQRGHFQIENFADDSKTVEMKRFVNMAENGWYSGDLDVQRPEKDLPLLMEADDVHVVPLVTWSNKKNPWIMRRVDESLRDSNPRLGETRPLPKTIVSQFDGDFFDSFLGGELLAPGNTLRLFRMDAPGQFPLTPALSPKEREKMPDALGSLPFLPAVEKARREQNAWVDAGALFARDLPIWIAAGPIDSVQVANRHLEREGVVDNEAGGWPRDLMLFPKPYGNGRWSQEIYYHLLNCGLRIPPTAGSGSGANNNPVGYNRLYVHVDAEPADGEDATSKNDEKVSWDRWWEALRAGRVTITNGPLIRTSVEGHLPGYVFHADAGQSLELLVALTLSTRDKIRYLDVIKNGRSEIEANLDEFKAAGGKLPPLKFKESGWFVVRAITENDKTYRYATTAPYYVEIGYQRRVSRGSAQFFLDWTNKRAEEIAKAGGDADAEAVQIARQAVEKAQAYWKAMLDKANVE